MGIYGGGCMGQGGEGGQGGTALLSYYHISTKFSKILNSLLDIWQSSLLSLFFIGEGVDKRGLGSV